MSSQTAEICHRCSKWLLSGVGAGENKPNCTFPTQRSALEFLRAISGQAPAIPDLKHVVTIAPKWSHRADIFPRRDAFQCPRPVGFLSCNRAATGFPPVLQIAKAVDVVNRSRVVPALYLTAFPPVNGCVDVTYRSCKYHQVWCSRLSGKLI